MVDRYERPVWQMTTNILGLLYHNPIIFFPNVTLSNDMYHWCTYISNATGSKYEARFTFPSRTPKTIPGFAMVRVAQSLVFYSVFCVLLFYVLPWSYQFVFDLPLRFCYLSFKLISIKKIIFTNVKMTANRNRRESPEYAISY